MNIEQIKANAPEGAQYFNTGKGVNNYYRIRGEAVQFYFKCCEEWVVSEIYTKEDLPSAPFIDLREQTDNWTPEENKMDIEKIKANAPEGAEYFNTANYNGCYYRNFGGVAQYYDHNVKDWIDSEIYTKAAGLSFIDLREQAQAWTPENNTLPLDQLTREQKIAMFAAWVDGFTIEVLAGSVFKAVVWSPIMLSQLVCRVGKSPRTAFIEQCKNLSVAEIYDAIKSGKLKID